MERGRDKGIKMSRNKDIATLLFMYICIPVAHSVGVLQISTHKLETVTSKYGLKISTSKMKTTAFNM
jgi:hypothetical protein